MRAVTNMNTVKKILCASDDLQFAEEEIQILRFEIEDISAKNKENPHYRAECKASDQPSQGPNMIQTDMHWKGQ